MGTMSTRLTNVFSVRYCEGNAPIRVMATDIRDLVPEVGMLLDDFAPDTFRGVPSFITAVLETLSTAARLRIKNVFLTGEMLTAYRARVFAEKTPDAAVRMLYVTSELGGLSSLDNCRYLRRNQYHPGEGVTIDIVGPDESGAGEVYISTTIEDEHIRQYRVGDVARFLPQCRCGAPVTFELVGRTGRDYVKLAGATLRREEFDRVVGLFPYVDDYRVEAREVQSGGSPKGQITLRLYRRGATMTDALLEETKNKFSRELFLTPTQTLFELVQKGVFLPLEIVQTAGPFTQENKDIKIRLISQ